MKELTTTQLQQVSGGDETPIYTPTATQGIRG
jgi:bacteriocin-like protein